VAPGTGTGTQASRVMYRVVCLHALLEELGYIPTEKYAKGDEILAHC
jgi:hypothetical protein